MSKQDRQGVRQASDLEQKYNFGKSFAEIMGIATDAQKKAEEANSSFEGLDHDAVFNLLTNNGELQGLFRGDDGELYINAEYIKAIEKLFAKDITMTGKFESTAMTYLPPTYDDAIQTMWASIFGRDEYPLPEAYDFDLNGDGEFNDRDAAMAMNVYVGNIAMKDCPGAVKTKVTIRINMHDPQKLIHIFGTNMWGTYVETFIGADVNNSSFASKDYLKRMINQDPNSSNLYRTVDGKTEYFNPPMELGVEYRTIERSNGMPVYVKRVDFNTLQDTGQSTRTYCTSGATMVRMVGRAVRTSDGLHKPLPFYTDSGTVLAVLSATKYSVIMNTFSDLTGYTGTVDCYYTKD